MNKLGIYLHLPFCRSICSYCDFYKMRAKIPRIRQYVDYIIKEIDIHEKNWRSSSDPYSIHTLYIGGGTPSFIPLGDLERLIARLNQWFPLNLLNEFTIEMNPEDITGELIALLKKYAISRVSIGIQSFDPLAHGVLKRVSNFEDVKQKIDLLRSSGITNINLDLMFGIPGMNHTLVKADLEKFLSLKPTHMSCYSLILEEKTLLYYQYQKGFFVPMDEDEEAAIYDLIKTTLLAHGYNHYETSNFALPGYESLHNLIYWNNERYLGIGAGSSSYLGSQRLKTISNLEHYFNLLDQGVVGYEESTTLTLDDQMAEEVMLGLRKTEGISLTHFKAKFGDELFNVFPNCVSLLDEGYLIREFDQIKINPQYHFLANYLLRKIL